MLSIFPAFLAGRAQPSVLELLQLTVSFGTNLAHLPRLLGKKESFDVPVGNHANVVVNVASGREDVFGAVAAFRHAACHCSEAV